MKKLNALIYAILLAISANVFAADVTGCYGLIDGGVSSFNTSSQTTQYTNTERESLQIVEKQYFTTLPDGGFSFHESLSVKTTETFVSVPHTALQSQHKTPLGGNVGFSLGCGDRVGNIYLGGAGDFLVNPSTGQIQGNALGKVGYVYPLHLKSWN